MSKLKEGDIFRLESGHMVYMNLPEHFVYDNREGVFDKLANTEVTVGEPKNGMQTDWLVGEYVVTGTSMNGPHDTYPDGHYVKAEKLQDNDFDHRVKVSFYQSGSFTAMITDIEPIGRATASWNREEAR